MVNWERVLLFTVVGMLFFFLSPVGLSGPTSFEMISGVQLGFSAQVGIALVLGVVIVGVIKYGYR